jgi:RNA recognition motif-containing protein
MHPNPQQHFYNNNNSTHCGMMYHPTNHHQQQYQQVSGGGIVDSLPMPMYAMASAQEHVLYRTHHQHHNQLSNFSNTHQSHVGLMGLHPHQPPPPPAQPTFCPPQVNSKGQSTILSTDNLIVRNLDKTITTEEFRALYSTFGAIKSCEVRRNHQTGESQGYGFVQFHDDNSAQKALDSTKGKTIKGLTLNVRFAYAHADPIPTPDDNTRITVGNFPANINPDTVVELVKQAGATAPNNTLIFNDFNPTVIRSREVVAAESPGAAPRTALLLDVHTPAMVQFLIENLNLRTVAFPGVVSALPGVIGGDVKGGLSAVSFATTETIVLHVKVAESQVQMQQRQRRKQLKDGFPLSGSVSLPSFSSSTTMQPVSPITNKTAGFDSISPQQTPLFNDHSNHRNSLASSVLTGGATPIASSLPLHQMSDPSRSDNPLFFIVPNQQSVVTPQGGAILPPRGDPNHHTSQRPSTSSASISSMTNLHAGAAHQGFDDISASKTSNDSLNRVNTQSSPKQKQRLLARLSHISAMVDSMKDETHYLEVERVLEHLQSLLTKSLPQPNCESGAVDAAAV